jgi:hypothetical protein
VVERKEKIMGVGRVASVGDPIRNKQLSGKTRTERERQKILFLLLLQQPY